MSHIVSLRALRLLPERDLSFRLHRTRILQLEHRSFVSDICVRCQIVFQESILLIAFMMAALRRVMVVLFVLIISKQFWKFVVVIFPDVDHSMVIPEVASISMVNHQLFFNSMAWIVPQQLCHFVNCESSRVNLVLSKSTNRLSIRVVVQVVVS
jgi:hypothetical protein